MISVDTLEGLADELYVYDVEQKGWEHEPKGYEFNANHVLKELVKNIAFKDFRDKEIVESEITPDSIQYALRFQRWAGFPVSKLVDYTPAGVWTAGRDRINVPYHQALFVDTVGVLEQHLHDLDHKKLRREAWRGKKEVSLHTSRLLIRSSQEAADFFDFDLATAFHNRLSSLRVRFGIPQPAIDQAR